MKAYEGDMRVSRRISPLILNIGTRWMWVVRSRSRSLYSRTENPRIPSSRRLGGTQIRCGRCRGM